jgi:MFS family permease
MSDADRDPQTPADSSFPPIRYAQFVVAVLTLVYTASFLDRQIITLIGERVRADLALSDVQLGLLQGLSFALFYTALGIPMGILADRGNRRRLILGGLILWSFATALCGLVSSYSWLFAARMLVGVGEAALAPAAYSLISDYFPRHRRARAMSVYTSGVLIGSGLAYMAGGAILPIAERASQMLLELGIHRTGWQVAFIAAALPGVVLPLLLLAVREPLRQERAPQHPAFGAGWHYLRSRKRIYLTLCLSLAAMAAVNYGNFAWLPAVFQRIHGYTPTEFGYAFGLVLIVLGPLGMLSGGILADRIRRQSPQQVALRICGIALLLMLPASALAPAVADVRLAWCLIGFQIFVVAMPLSLGPVVLQLATPNQFRGLVMALYMFATNIVGLGIGPLVPALLSDHFFQDERMIGAALGIESVLFLPFASVSLLWLAHLSPQPPPESASEQEQQGMRERLRGRWT